MNCPYCGDPLDPKETLFMVSFDRPYLNVYVHKHHWSNDRDNLYSWAVENVDMLLEMHKNGKLFARTLRKY